MANNFDQSSTGVNIECIVGFELKGSKEALIKYGCENYVYFADIEDYSPEILQELHDEIINDLRPTLLTFGDLNSYDLKDSGLEFVPTKQLTTMAWLSGGKIRR